MRACFTTYVVVVVAVIAALNGAGENRKAEVEMLDTCRGFLVQAGAIGRQALKRMGRTRGQLRGGS
jgi:hypothetical protein